jgi:hypothetical protein
MMPSRSYASQQSSTVSIVTTPDLALATITTIVGAIMGLAGSYWFFRRGAARTKIAIGMEELAHIDPATVGVRVEMKVGTREVNNLLLLEVVVTNQGPNDIHVKDADDASKHHLRPRIELPVGVRALADPWNPERSLPRAEVRLARRLQGERQVIFVHIHRLAKGATSRARILCTYHNCSSSPAVKPSALQFYPGFLKEVDIQPVGLLRKPAKQLEE